MDQSARAPTQSVGRHVPNTMDDLILGVCGVRWDGLLYFFNSLLVEI